MIDINREPGDYKYTLQKVGFIKIKHNILYLSRKNEPTPTIAEFSILSELKRDIRGVHMSRPVRMLQYFDTHICSDENIVEFLHKILETCETDEVFFEMEYDHELKKKAPITDTWGSRYYKIIKKKNIHKEHGILDDCIVLTIPVTTSCACSKAISNYSSHNQRGYVTVTLHNPHNAVIEDIIELVESAASSPIFPVLKRADEKYVTEQVYDNARIVEDLARIVAEKIDRHIATNYFKIRCRIEESILPYDSYAEVEVKK